MNVKGSLSVQGIMMSTSDGVKLPWGLSEFRVPGQYREFWKTSRCDLEYSQNGCPAEPVGKFAEIFKMLELLAYKIFLEAGTSLAHG